MCIKCVEWGGKKWHVYGDNEYYERTDKSVRPKRTLRLHREKWLAEVGPIPDGHHVHHKNEDKQDNRLENLECMAAGDHMREHRPHGFGVRPTYDTIYVCECYICGKSVERRIKTAKTKCKSCTYREAEEKRKVKKTCTHCGTEFISRAGTLCSQRCVNLATNGATVRILP